MQNGNKCKECSIDSIKYDLCISCNEGYYPKLNDNIINDSFINCYKVPEGYYLDNKIYKPCFKTCKQYYGYGNETIHNCRDCINYYSFINDSYRDKNCYENCSYYFYLIY